MNNRDENAPINIAQVNEVKITTPNSDSNNFESQENGLVSGSIVSNNTNLPQNNSQPESHIDAKQPNPKIQEDLFDFWQFLPRKLIYIYAIVSVFSYLIPLVLAQIMSAEIVPAEILYNILAYLPTLDNLSNLASLILIFLIINSCLISLNKLALCFYNM